MVQDDKTRIRRSEPPTLAYLIATNGRRAGDAHQLSSNFLIGRSGACDLRIDDDLVSEEHARIRKDDESGGFVISDLASTNNTTVNGEEISRVTLQTDDRVQIGDQVLVFKQL